MDTLALRVFSGIDGIEKKIPELKKYRDPIFWKLRFERGPGRTLGGRLLLHVKISRHLCWPVVKPIDMEYFNPVAIHFGEGVRKEVVAECSGKRVLVICSAGTFKRFSGDSGLRGLFDCENVSFESGFGSNPSLRDVEQICCKYKKTTFDLIVGIGGGSAMDVAKILCLAIPAARMELSIDTLIDEPESHTNIQSVPCIQVPTTAGTGSEVTPFATIWDYKSGRKKSLSSSKIFASKVFLDPDFIASLPPRVALSTGLDALNQAFESIWNLNATDISRCFSRQSAVLLLRQLPNLSKLSSNFNLRRPSFGQLVCWNCNQSDQNVHMSFDILPSYAALRLGSRLSVRILDVRGIQI